MKPLLDRKRVPVMGGFIAATREGIGTTLGRGGSDFSAAIIGAGLNAERIEIWTDVDGMMTTDPNLCPDARRIKNISFEEAAELAYFGAKVLHPATLLPAIQKNIPVLILNSRNPKCEGTRITATAPKSKNIFKAIAAKKRITVVDVVATRMLMAHGFLKSIFEVFANHRCPVDMVSTSEVSVSVTVDSNESIAAIAADLAKLADVKYEGRKAIVCLVGENIKSTPGIAAKVFSAIPEANIHMISQGASEINIGFVIDEDAVPDVVSRLHRDILRAGGSRGVRMKVLVLGRGKTGALVAEVAKERRHEVRSLASQENQDGRALTPATLKEIDAVIDFTTPHAAIPNIIHCVEAGVPIVVGTTGWYQHIDKVRELTNERKAAVLYGSNFSIGMNFFFKAVQAVAPILKHQYRGSIVERHHVHKKDKPSGTAVTIQKLLEAGSGEKVEVASVREGETVGMHLVMLDSANDTILFTHDAKSRVGFAEGAVRAAEWIKGKTGFYEFPEIVDQL